MNTFKMSSKRLTYKVMVLIIKWCNNIGNIIVLLSNNLFLKDRTPPTVDNINIYKTLIKCY